MLVRQKKGNIFTVNAWAYKNPAGRTASSDADARLQVSCGREDPDSRAAAQPPKASHRLHLRPFLGNSGQNLLPRVLHVAERNTGTSGLL